MGLLKPEQEVPAMATHALVGSEKEPVPGAQSVGKADPSERLEDREGGMVRSSDAAGGKWLRTVAHVGTTPTLMVTPE
jgi:hypothetical protein